MITDIQLRWFMRVISGEVKKKDDPRTYSAYLRRIRERIDHMMRNLRWLAENRPDILQDMRYELADEEIPLKRRARGLLEIVALFENEPTVLMLMAEIYTEHVIEVSKKKKSL